MAAKKAWLDSRNKKSTKNSEIITKPKPFKSESKQLVCLCVKLNVLNSFNGTGCFVCETAVKYNRKTKNNRRPFFNTNNQCTCDVCICPCKVIYKRDQSLIVARQAHEEREEKQKREEEKSNCKFVIIL